MSETVSDRVSALEEELARLRERQLDYVFRRGDAYLTRDLQWTDDVTRASRLRSERVARNHLELYARRGKLEPEMLSQIEICLLPAEL